MLFSPLPDILNDTKYTIIGFYFVRNIKNRVSRNTFLVGGPFLTLLQDTRYAILCGMKKTLLFLLFFCFIVGLFISSAQTYEQQSLIPSLKQWLPGKPFEALLIHLEIPYWGRVISIEERGYYHFVEFLLRKSAHFFVFGALACVIYLLLPKHAIRKLTALFITFLFAAADEYHQSLTGGRTATYQDVILDMSGAVICLLILLIIMRFTVHKKRSSEG